MRSRSLYSIIIILVGVSIAATHSGTLGSYMRATNHSPASKQFVAADLDGKTFSVAKVIDGDTLDISVSGSDVRIRLIGLDTPETVDPRKIVQCFGREASDKAKQMLTGTSVHLELDPSQGMYDKYGRVLAYIFLADDTLFNKYMIAEGYGHEYTYDLPYKYKKDFKAAEKSAREQQKGLWSPTSCNGDTTQAAK